MNRAHGFVMAAHDGDIVKVRAYLDDGMDLDSPDHFYEGATALQLSIYEKAVHGSSVHGDIARLLLERGVAPTLGLHLAVIWQQKELVILCLEKGARVNDKNGYLFTPLQESESGEHGRDKEIIALLKQAGAKE